MRGERGLHLRRRQGPGKTGGKEKKSVKYEHNPIILLVNSKKGNQNPRIIYQDKKTPLPTLGGKMKKRKSVKYQHIIFLVHNNKEGLESQNDLPGKKVPFRDIQKKTEMDTFSR